MSAATARKKVLVSGCFDLLHSGHVQFFREAAEHGDLFVRVGSDDNIRHLKQHATMCVPLVAQSAVAVAAGLCGWCGADRLASQKMRENADIVSFGCCGGAAACFAR